MAWDDEKEELLAKLLGQGLSASQIAARINARYPLQRLVTRNAVIGKRVRLGLPERGNTPSGHHSKPRQNRTTMRRSPTKTSAPTHGNTIVRALFQSDGYVPPTEEVVIPVGERKTLQMLEADDCRWPIGDTQDAGFHFCAREKVPGLPYCEAHAKRAYQPPQTTQRRMRVVAAGVRSKETEKV